VPVTAWLLVQGLARLLAGAGVQVLLPAGQHARPLRGDAAIPGLRPTVSPTR